MIHRIDLLERLAELAWGPATRRIHQAGLTLEHHLVDGEELAVVTGARGGVGILVAVPRADQVEGVVYQLTEVRERLRPRVLDRLPEVRARPALVTLSDDPALDCWAGVALDPSQCSVTSLEQARQAALRLVDQQVEWLQTEPAGGTAREVAQVVDEVQKELAARGYVPLDLHRWAHHFDPADDAVGGVRHPDPTRWAFGGSPEFLILPELSADLFLWLNRARFPIDCCVVELRPDVVRVAGALGWLAFHVELSPRAQPGDAELLPALERAFSATGKLLQVEDLPRDIFGVHRPVTVMLSRTGGTSAIYVDHPTAVDGPGRNRDAPLLPHGPATRALTAVLHDLDNERAYEALWNEVVEALRWYRR